MVTLRRRPRQQRQCNISKDENATKTETTPAKKPRKSEKENLVSNKSSDIVLKTPDKKQPAKKQTGKKPAKSPTIPKKEKDEAVQQEESQINSRRSKRSRIDKTPLVEPDDAVPKVTPGGLVYEVGRRKSKDSAGGDEFVLRLNNSAVKSKKHSKHSAADEPDAKPLNREYCSPNRKTTQSKTKSVSATTPTKVTPIQNKDSKSPGPAKKSLSKSPLKLSMKAEPRSPNQIFKVPRSSFGRRQRVSVEAAAEVKSQEKAHSVCSMILNKKRKKSSKEDLSAAKEDKMITAGASSHPLFAGISPIIVSKREIEKLETLEKSMNLFECPMSPIESTDQKSKLNYSHLALKSEIKSLPKRVKTKPPKKAEAKNSKGCTKKGSKSKTSSKKSGDSSLLKTPIRQVFKSKTTASATEPQNTSLLFEEDSEESAGESGFTLYPLSDKRSWEPKRKPKAPAANKSNSKKEENAQKMDYDNWLEDHKSDYDQFKDLELCVE